MISSVWDFSSVRWMKFVSLKQGSYLFFTPGFINLMIQSFVTPSTEIDSPLAQKVHIDFK